MQNVKSIILHFQNEQNEKTQIELKKIKYAKISNVTQIFRAMKLSGNEDPILLQDQMSTSGAIFFSDIEAHDRVADIAFVDYELFRIDLVTDEDIVSFFTPEGTLLTLNLIDDKTSNLSYRY